MYLRKKLQKGFGFIDMMVALSLLGILSSVVVVYGLDAQKKNANIKKTVAELKNIANRIEMDRLSKVTITGGRSTLLAYKQNYPREYNVVYKFPDYNPFGKNYFLNTEKLTYVQTSIPIPNLSPVGVTVISSNRFETILRAYPTIKYNISRARNKYIKKYYYDEK